jgi:hypothetical protein
MMRQVIRGANRRVRFQEKPGLPEGSAYVLINGTYGMPFIFGLIPVISRFQALDDIVSADAVRTVDKTQAVGFQKFPGL